MNKVKKYAFLLAVIVICTGIVFVTLIYAEERIKSMPKYKSEIIKLPEPRYDSSTSVEEALFKRRSIRDYKEGSLKLAEITITAAAFLTGGWPRAALHSSILLSLFTTLSSSCLWGLYL